MRFLPYLAVSFGLAVSWAHPAHAQTVPPAATSAEATPNFSGTWLLDRNLSDDPSRANFEAGRPQSGRRPGGFGGGSSRRGGFGGSPSGSRDTAAASTPDERSRLQVLTNQLKKASASLVISHHDSSFVIDAQDHAQFFQTNGTPDEHHLGSVTVTSTTRWEGSRLVTAYALSSRQNLVYTYTLLPTTRQLVLRVRRDATEGPRANGPELMLVYTLAPSEP